MTYGFEIRGPDGALRLSSDSLPAMLKDLISIPAGSASSRGYPDLVGYTLFYTQVGQSFGFYVGFGSEEILNGVTISYPGGVPTISWNGAASVASILYVFAK